jgi:hypothetical protein
MSTPRNRRRLPSARRCHAPGPVPPPRFPTALTACSIRRLRVCCTPLPARGSPRFLPGATGLRPKTAPGHPHIPRDAASHPSKDSPRQQPYRVTAAVALLSSPPDSRLATTAPSEPLEVRRAERLVSFGTSRVAAVRPERSSGIPTGVFLPLARPARPDPPWFRLRRRSCRSSSARVPGVARSPPLLVPPHRYGSGWWAVRRRGCTRWQRPTGFRTVSTRSRSHPSEEARFAVSFEPRPGGGRITGVILHASPRPARGRAGILSMPSGSAVSPVLDGDAPVHRGGPPRHHGDPSTRPGSGLGCLATRLRPPRWLPRGDRGSSASRLRSLFARSLRIVVVPRLRSPDRPGVPFSSDALPSPGDPPLPTEVGDGLRWTRARRSSRTTSHDRLWSASRPFPTARSPTGVLDSRALLRRRVRCAIRPLLVGERPILPWALFPSKVLLVPPLDGLDARLAPGGATHTPGTRVSLALTPDLTACRRVIPPSVHRCTSCTSTEIEKVPRESVRTRSCETCAALPLVRPTGVALSR